MGQWIVHIRSGLKCVIRDTARSVIFILSTALAGTIFCASGSVWLTTLMAEMALDDAYVTIAVPKDPELVISMPSGIPMQEQVAIHEKAFNEWSANKQRLVDSQAILESSSHVKALIKRKALSAEIVGSMGITSGYDSPMNYAIGMDAPYDNAAFQVRCTNLQIEKNVNGWRIHPDGTETPTYEYAYSFEGVVTHQLVLHPSYQTPEKISVFGVCVREDNSVPFVEGKEYLIWGKYSDIGYSESYEKDAEGNVERVVVAAAENPTLRLGDYLLETREELEIGDELWNATREDERMPICAEIDDPLDACLDQPHIAAFMNVVDRISRCHQSVPVIALDRVRSMPSFVQGENFLSEGRDFSGDDISRGNKVCIVNSQWAHENNLGVGDSIHMNLKRAEYVVDSSMDGDWWTPNPLLSSDEGGEQADYMIIGEYSPSNWIRGEYMISPNTIFIPQLKEGDDYFTEMPVLRTIVLENGHVALFEEEMAQAGYSGLYSYIDQGFEDAVRSINSARMDAERIALLGMMAWFVLEFAFMIILVNIHRRNVETLIFCGVEHSKRIVFLLSGISALLLVATVIEAFLSRFSIASVLDYVNPLYANGTSGLHTTDAGFIVDIYDIIKAYFMLLTAKLLLGMIIAFFTVKNNDKRCTSKLLNSMRD